MKTRRWRAGPRTREKCKPVEGTIRPDEAMQRLAIFESKYSRIKEERDNVGKAKEALELQKVGPSSALEDRMVEGWEELQDIKGVWSEINRTIALFLTLMKKVYKSPMVIDVLGSKVMWHFLIHQRVIMWVAANRLVTGEQEPKQVTKHPGESRSNS